MADQDDPISEEEEDEGEEEERLLQELLEPAVPTPTAGPSPGIPATGMTQEEMDRMTEELQNNPELAELFDMVKNQYPVGTPDATLFSEAISRLLQESLTRGTEEEEEQEEEPVGRRALLEKKHFLVSVHQLLKADGIEQLLSTVRARGWSLVSDELLVVPGRGGCTDKAVLQNIWTEMQGSVGGREALSSAALSRATPFQILEATYDATLQLNKRVYDILFKEMIKKKNTVPALTALNDELTAYATAIELVLNFALVSAQYVIPDDQISAFVIRSVTVDILPGSAASALVDPAVLVDWQKKFTLLASMMRLINWDLDQVWEGAKGLARVIDPSLRVVGKTKKGDQRAKRASQLHKSPCPPTRAEQQEAEERQEEVQEEEERGLGVVGTAPGRGTAGRGVGSRSAGRGSRGRGGGGSASGQQIRGVYTAKNTIDKKSWGHRKYEIENFALRLLQEATVARQRDAVQLWRDLELAAGSIRDPDMKLYLAKQKTESGLFSVYLDRFRGLIQKGEIPMFLRNLVPTPFAQSTYLVDTASVELANTFMWPDRFAQSLNPYTMSLLEHVGLPRLRDYRVRCQILSDLADPWYHYLFRQKRWPRLLVEGRVALSKIGTYVAQTYVAQTATGASPFHDETVWNPDETEVFFTDTESLLFDGSTRDNKDLRDSEAAATSQPGNAPADVVYKRQYLNRIARGLDVFEKPDGSAEPYVMGDHVFMPVPRFAWKNVEDVIHLDMLPTPAEQSTATGEGSTAESSPAFLSDYRASCSEFTLYMDRLQPLTCISTDTTIGTFLSYTIDLHPATLLPPDPNAETSILPRAAGHTYHMELEPAHRGATDEFKLPWFKELLKTKKNAGSRNPDKPEETVDELTKFDSWFPKTVTVDAVCENSSNYDWQNFPEWMLLMFKLLVGLAYWGRDRVKNELHDEYEEYLVMIPLDKLKRFGNVPENLFVYLLRRYLQFGLALDHRLEENYWQGRGESKRYFHDFWIKDYAKIYSHDDQDLLEKSDVHQPVLLRPIPTVEEAWKLWQFYTQHIMLAAVTRDEPAYLSDRSTLPGSTSENLEATAAARAERAKVNQRVDYPEMITDLNQFIEGDLDLKCSRLRAIKVGSGRWSTNAEQWGKKYTMEYVRTLENTVAVYDPLIYDQVEVDWATGAETPLATT